MAGATPWPSTPTPNGGATATADGDRPLFATALRGYERNQVDDYLTQRDKDAFFMLLDEYVFVSYPI